MAVSYSKSSPYYSTEMYGNFMDVMTPRTFPKLADDVSVTINAVYRYRPDLLSYDLYGDSRLWWVFAIRNPNTITDPIWDFKEGTTIFVPKKETLTSALGL